MSRLSAILLVLCAKIVFADESIGLCCLCDHCGPPLLDRLKLEVDGSGTTCQELSVDMADPTNESLQGNAECNALKNAHYDRCCNRNHDPLPVAQDPTPAPGGEYEEGPHPPCNLCRSTDFPSLPYTGVAILYDERAKTCKDLYWYALKGGYEARLCRPIQNYFNEPCGCHEGEGNGNNGNGNNGNGGGAPDQGEDPEEDEHGNPPKKTVPDDSKDSKLGDMGNDDRGIDRRRLRVRGSR